MLDRIFYKFFSWIDDQFKKVEDIFNMDFTNFSKRKKKKCKCGKK
jgi:hypothetical protein